MLAAAGLDVSEHPFEFSSMPAQFGPPIGAGCMSIALVIAHLMISHSLPGAALGVLVAALVSLRAAGKWLVGSGVSIAPWSRISSSNLVAVPRGTVQQPEIWLVAHLDSKSQTIPMLVRVASVAASAVFVTITVVVLAGTLLAGAPATSGFALPHESAAIGVAWLAPLFAAISLVPLLMCFIGNRSAGALDNASGVACVILALEMIRNREKVGVIITSGEELGLAGARAIAAEIRATGIALNCDTIDDHGHFLCMTSGSMPDRLSTAIDRAAMRTGIAIRKSRMLPGILADNIAFTKRGWDSFTLSRGNLGTLARVHTSSDRAAKIDGTGIAIAAALLAATAEELF